MLDGDAKVYLRFGSSQKKYLAIPNFELGGSVIVVGNK